MGDKKRSSAKRSVDLRIAVKSQSPTRAELIELPQGQGVQVWSAGFDFHGRLVVQDRGFARTLERIEYGELSLVVPLVRPELMSSIFYDAAYLGDGGRFVSMLGATFATKEAWLEVVRIWFIRDCKRVSNLKRSGDLDQDFELQFGVGKQR